MRWLVDAGVGFALGQFALDLIAEGQFIVMWGAGIVIFYYIASMFIEILEVFFGDDVHGAQVPN